MAKEEKKRGFIELLKGGFSFISQVISESILPSITEGTEMVMKKIDDRVLVIEKRIMKKISTFLIIGFGGVFLIFALLFFMIDSLVWSKTLAFFSIGIIVLVIGLILKIRESER